MVVAVFGSTGGTGRELLTQALAAGHQVRAFARRREDVAPESPDLTVQQADVLDRRSLEGTLDGVDCVLSALGNHQNRPTEIYSSGVRNILVEMARSGCTRILAISALPLADAQLASPLERRIMFPLVHRFFGHGYRDMARMEEELRASTVDWTVVRPPRLVDRPSGARVRRGFGEHLPRARSIGRADLAATMLELVAEPRALRCAVEVAY